jgi:Uma2 family endonuclease
MARLIKSSFGSYRGENSIYKEQNEKWQRDSIKERIKDDFKKYPYLLNEILSELRKEKLEKIKKKMK